MIRGPPDIEEGGTLFHEGRKGGDGRKNLPPFQNVPENRRLNIVTREKAEILSSGKRRSALMLLKAFYIDRGKKSCARGKKSNRSDRKKKEEGPRNKPPYMSSIADRKVHIPAQGHLVGRKGIRFFFVNACQ